MNTLYDFRMSSRSANVAFVLRQATKVYLRAIEMELRQVGASISYFDVLWVIKFSRHSPTQAEIARLLSQKPSTIFATINRMQRDRLVTKQQDEDNKRLTRIKLTSKGEKVYKKAFFRGLELVSRILSPLQEQKDMSFLEELQLLRENAAHEAGLEIIAPDSNTPE